jgi:hypothetical protein
MPKSLVERFRSKYIPVPESGCWLWLDSLDKDGYGRLQLPGKQSVKAHRLSYQLQHGELPSLCILHRCDVRCCVNPAHLYAGTLAQNNQDCITRGRYRSGGKPHPGERNGRARVTAEQAVEIRRRYLSGERSGDLGREFGLTYGAIWRLATGRAWKHL